MFVCFCRFSIFFFGVNTISLVIKEADTRENNMWGSFLKNAAALATEQAQSIVGNVNELTTKGLASATNLLETLDGLGENVLEEDSEETSNQNETLEESEAITQSETLNHSNNHFNQKPSGLSPIGSVPEEVFKEVDSSHERLSPQPSADTLTLLSSNASTNNEAPNQAKYTKAVAELKRYKKQWKESERERQHLEQENDELKISVATLSKELLKQNIIQEEEKRRLSNSVEEYKNEMENLRLQLSFVQKQDLEKEEKLNLMHKQLEEKKEEIHVLQKNYDTLHQEYKLSLLPLQQSSMTLDELDENHAKVSEENNKLLGQIKELTLLVESSEENTENTIKTIEQLRVQYDYSQKENGNLVRTNQLLQEELELLKKSMKDLTQKLEEYKTLQTEKEEEYLLCKKYETELESLRIVLNEREILLQKRDSEISILSLDMEQLRETIIQREKGFSLELALAEEKFMHQITEKERYIETFASLKQQLRHYEEENNRLNMDLEDKLRIILGMEAKIQGSEQEMLNKLQQHQFEKESSSEALRLLHVQYDELLLERDSLKLENSQHRNALSMQAQAIEVKRIEDQSPNTNLFQQQLQEYEKILEIRDADVTNLRQEKTSLEQVVAEFQISVQEKLDEISIKSAIIENLEGQKERYLSELTTSKTEILALNEKVKVLEASVDNKLRMIEVLENEVEFLKEKLDSGMSEAEKKESDTALMKELEERVDHLLTENNLYADQIQHLQEKIAEYLQENQRLHGAIIEATELQEKANEVMTQLQKEKEEILDQFHFQQNEWKLKKQSYQQTIHESEEEIQRLKSLQDLELSSKADTMSQLQQALNLAEKEHAQEKTQWNQKLNEKSELILSLQQQIDDQLNKQKLIMDDLLSQRLHIQEEYQSYKKQVFAENEEIKAELAEALKTAKLMKEKNEELSLRSDNDTEIKLTLQNRIAHLEAEIDKFNQKKGEHEQQNLERDQKIDSLREEALALTLELNSVQTSSAKAAYDLQQALDHKQSQNDKLQAQLHSLQNLLKENEVRYLSEVKALQKAATERESLLHQQRNQFSQQIQSKELELQNLLDQCSQMKEERKVKIIQLEKDRTELAKEIKQLQVSQEQMKRDHSKELNNSAENISKLERLTSEYNALQEQYLQLEKKKKKDLEHFTKLNETISRLKKTIYEEQLQSQEKIEELEATNSSLSDRLKRLEDDANIQTKEIPLTESHGMNSSSSSSPSYVQVVLPEGGTSPRSEVNYEEKLENKEKELIELTQRYDALAEKCLQYEMQVSQSLFLII